MPPLSSFYFLLLISPCPSHPSLPYADSAAYAVCILHVHARIRVNGIDECVRNHVHSFPYVYARLTVFVVENVAMFESLNSPIVLM